MDGPPFEEPMDDEERAPAPRTDEAGGQGPTPKDLMSDEPTTRGSTEDDEDESPSEEITGEP